MGPQYDVESSNAQSATSLTVGDYARTPLCIADRPPMTPGQKICSGLFYGQLFVQFAACVCVLMTQNTYYAPSQNPGDTQHLKSTISEGPLKPAGGTCIPGYTMDTEGLGELCIKSELKAQLDSCVPQADPRDDSDQNNGGRRLIENKLDDQQRHKGSMQPRNQTLLLLLLGGVALFCLAWFMLLAKFASAMLWGMLAINVAMMCYMFYLTSNWMLLIIAAVVIVLAYLGRTQIEVAITAMGLASAGLQAAPWTFVVSFAFQMGWLVYAIAFSMASSFVQRSQAVGPDCKLGPSWVASFWMIVCPIFFIFTTLFFKNCILSVVAMSIGCWYFPEETVDVKEETCGSPALYGGKLALTTSSGSVFGASLIMGVVEVVKRHAEHPCWWMDPLACFLKALACALQGTIGGLTRFALIAQLFHGDDLCHMGQIQQELLSRHLPSAVATGFLANVIMNQIAMGLSTSFGFLVWFVLDMREGLGVFQSITTFVVQNADTKENFRNSQLVVVFLTWSMYLGARRPIVTLFWSTVLLAFADAFDWLFHWLFGCPWGMFESFIISQAMAAMASIIFSYMGCVLEYATDTVFYCMAVESECGRVDARTIKLHDLMQKQLKDEEDATDASRQHQ
mmetsp:Transcript_83163/g.165061  ORF Transcript_83163/g.165061 Transcript_83163/m.165061 type:complete len:623 (-) Transcript_83163:22-1890(-)